MGGLARSRSGELSPGGGRLTAGRPSEARFAGAGPGEREPTECDAIVGGHDDVSRPCAGHRAPTASVVAPISFTYHLPLCRSTTDILYFISSFDVIPGFPATDPDWSGSCQITATVICLVAPPGGT